MGRTPTHWLEFVWGPVATLVVQIALRALGRALRLGKGTGCVLALLATNGHAEERSPEPVASGVFYVSATVVADGAGGPRERGTAVAFANAECGWDDPPPGATVGCVAPVAEGARQRIVIRQVDAEGEPVPAETDLEFRYRTMPISATAGADYVSASGTLMIEAGETVSSAATFTTIDDVLDEFQEAFAVELGNDPESPLELELDYVVIPIQDNDPEVRVSMEGEDGAEDAGILSFEVSLSGTSGKTVTVDYATSDGHRNGGRRLPARRRDADVRAGRGRQDCRSGRHRRCHPRAGRMVRAGADQCPQRAPSARSGARHYSGQ